MTPPSSPQTQIDLLIAESDASVRESYDSKGRQLGLRVGTATDGLDCWAKLHSSLPDALVIDMNLLWGGAEGVLDRFRKESAALRAPTVFVVGDESPDALSKRTGTKVEHCFQKPINVGSLLEFVKTAVTIDRQLPGCFNRVWRDSEFRAKMETT